MEGSQLRTDEEQKVLDESVAFKLMQEEGGFVEMDMGKIDDEEKQYFIIDKDTGEVYDIRSDTQVERVTF